MSADLETRLDRAMKPKRARKPNPVRRFRDELAKALHRLDASFPNASVDMVDHDGKHLYFWIFTIRLDESEHVAALFDGIREACR